MISRDRENKLNGLSENQGNNAEYRVYLEENFTPEQIQEAEEDPALRQLKELGLTITPRDIVNHLMTKKNGTYHQGVIDKGGKTD
jgi:hypothetical protein